MADGLYTGIALSGKEQVDNSGQRALLQAEKDAAQQRLREQQEKKKGKDKLLEEVRKNTVISQDVKTPYYQRKLANKAYETIGEIIESINSGEDNPWVIAKSGTQKYEVYKNAIEKADESLQGTIKKVREKPFDYAFGDKQTINGKEYSSFLEAINDPYADTEEGIQEIMSKYGGDEYIFQKNDPQSVEMGLPELIVGYDPIPMVNPKEFAREIAKQKEMFSEPKVGKPTLVEGTDKSLIPVGYGIPQRGLSAIEEELFSNKGVRRYYEEQMYQEQKSQNPDLTRAEFLKTDWISEVPKRIESEVINDAATWMENPSFREYTPPKEKDAKKSKFAEDYSTDIPPSIEKKENSIYGKKTYRIRHPYKGSRPPVKPVTVREGTKEYDKGKLKDVDNSMIKSSVSMTPMGIDFVTDDNNVYFLYKREEVPSGDEFEEKEREVLVAIPFTQSAFNEYAQNVGAESISEIAEQIKSVVNVDEQEELQKMLDKLGVGNMGSGEGGQEEDAEAEVTNPFE